MKILVPLLFYAVTGTAVFYPLWIWFDQTSFSWDSGALFDIFPVLGLAAFSIMWVHVASSPFKLFLNRFISMERFGAWSSIIVLFLLILHPLILFIGLGIDQVGNFFSNAQTAVWIGVAGWIVLISYDILKPFRLNAFLVKNWELVKFISTLGFFLIFFHSLFLGSHLQTPPLLYVWIFYGISAGLATLYTYGKATIHHFRP